MGVFVEKESILAPYFLSEGMNHSSRNMKGHSKTTGLVHSELIATRHSSILESASFGEMLHGLSVVFESNQLTLPVLHHPNALDTILLE